MANVIGRLRFELLAIAVSMAATASHAAAKPIWANGATALDLSCSFPRHLIESPDRNSSIRVLCQSRSGADNVYTLRVQTRKGSHDLPLDEGAHEILWAPDSQTFLVDGGTSAYAGFFVSVFQLDGSGAPRRLNVTKTAQRDMLASFPPCKAQNLDRTGCMRIEDNPEFNMSGVAWSRESSTINIVAEVPCSSSYGGIMCQVLGYEIQVNTGSILKRLTAKQVAHVWQQSLAWKLRVPDPPVYSTPPEVSLPLKRRFR